MDALSLCDTEKYNLSRLAYDRFAQAEAFSERNVQRNLYMKRALHLDSIYADHLRCRF